VAIDAITAAESETMDSAQTKVIIAALDLRTALEKPEAQQ
jgi:hypothetical protein